MKFTKPSLKNILITISILLAISTSIYFILLSMEPQIPVTEVIELPPPIPPTVEEMYPHEVKPQSTLFSILRALDVSPQVIGEIVKAAKPVTDLTKIKPGTRFQLIQEISAEPIVSEIKFRFSASESLKIKKVNEVWTAEKIIEKVETKVVTFAGVVVSSLWKSAENAKMDPNLISDLAEIFGWQVDFSREVRVKDRWRLSVEQKFIKGDPVGWGNIIAAEYENAGELHTAVLFHFKDGETGYFAPDGSSLRRMFLKSPIKFGRISSRFSKSRFHPILQIHRPHLGVDYAAPVGTPIRSVGDGVITFAGWLGGAGKTIKMRHNSTYQTAFKHLSGYARNIRNGVRVRQGEIIGYVGNTGLSTGSHLHFEFYQNGQYVDPLGKKFPSADPVPADMLTQFKTETPTILSSLPSWDRALEAERSAAANQSADDEPVRF
jgi:murein DD-endopeptidase MepM/ murein hydrolase activator NlpD